MANVTGSQPDIKCCPICQGKLKNVPREEMVSKAHKRRDGTVAEYTHTYQCKNQKCQHRFEINQAR